MNYDTENDNRRMLPGPEGSQYWSPTDWYREAVDVLTEYIESGDRLMAAGTRPHTRDYFKLTSLSRQIVAVRDVRNERNQMRSGDPSARDATDFGA
jgi:hypothetical protein